MDNALPRIDESAIFVPIPFMTLPRPEPALFPLTVELWRGDRIERVLAQGVNQIIMKAAYVEACRQYPDETVCFRFRNRVIAERLKP